MSRGDKSHYTDKQKRKANHIEESEKNRRKSAHDAGRIAWATVNKEDGGGKKSKKIEIARPGHFVVHSCGKHGLLFVAESW